MNGLEGVRENHACVKPLIPQSASYGMVLLFITLSVAGIVLLGRLLVHPEDGVTPSSLQAVSHSVSRVPEISVQPDSSQYKSGYAANPRHVNKNLARPGPDLSPFAVIPPQQLIDELLWLLDQAPGDETSGQVRRLLKQLADQGSAAVPMIREFLLSGEDHSLEEYGVFRHSSLRLTLIDVLRQAGGEAAQLVSLELLESNISGQEFVALSSYLQTQDPGFYQAEIQQAGRQILTQTADLDSVELGPVYQFLAEAGATSAADLKQAPDHQQHYANVALALLPDGAGVPALLDELRQSDLNFENQLDRLNLKLLAQLAGERPEAAATLAELASQGLIPDRLWPEIAAIAAGLEQIRLNDNIGSVVNRQHISSPFGNQVLYRSRTGGPSNAAEALARLQIVERLYQVAPGDAANRALVSAFDRIPQRWQ